MLSLTACRQRRSWHPRSQLVKPALTLELPYKSTNLNAVSGSFHNNTDTAFMYKQAIRLKVLQYSMVIKSLFNLFTTFIQGNVGIAPSHFLTHQHRLSDGDLALIFKPQESMGHSPVRYHKAVAIDINSNIIA